MTGWYRTVAENNPLTWMVDGMRTQVLVGFDLPSALVSIGVAGATVVLGLWYATAQVRRRLRVAS
jgi:hypothetical protein